jgi:hypothetical protein
MLSQQGDASEGTIELTAIPVNHTGHEDAEGEEPPPLPPPRGESLSRSHFAETESSPINNHGTQIMYYEGNWKNLNFCWFIILPDMACLTFLTSVHRWISVDTISEVEAHV